MVAIAVVFLFKQKTAYEMRISDWSSDVCSSDLLRRDVVYRHGLAWRPTATCQNPTDARQQSVGHAANNAALNRISEAVHQWVVVRVLGRDEIDTGDRKSTRLNSSH